MMDQPNLPPRITDDEEKQRRNKVSADARDLIIRLGSLLRQLRMHAADNASVRNQIEFTENAITTLRQDTPTISMVLAEGHAFVNGVWIRASRLMWDHAVTLTEAMRKLSARGLVLTAEFSPRSSVPLAQALRDALDAAEAHPKPPDLGIPGVKLIELPEQDKVTGPRGEQASFRQKARHLLREGLLVAGRNSAHRLDLAMRRRQRNLVQELVRLAEDSPEDLLAITAIRDPTLPEGAHNLTVTILSIALGKLLGFSRKDLVRLGTSALSHNLGDAYVHYSIPNQPQELNQQEREVIETHALMGLYHVLQNYGVEGNMLDRAVVCAEHHMHWDGKGGYPFALHTQPHPFSRIIAVCDVFAALISDRPYREAYPPDQALRLISHLSGEHKKLDPVLGRMLVGVVGRYPPGSLVELNTGEWAVVLGPGRGATPLKRPRVLMITDADGFELPHLEVVDLGERHPRRRAWLRTIVTTIDPSLLDTRVSAYLLADRIEEPPKKLDIDDFKERKKRRSRRKRDAAQR